MNRDQDNPSTALSSDSMATRQSEIRYDDEGNVIRKKKDGPAPKPLATIAQQFREAKNMAYELDCEGKRMTLRIFELGGTWRIEGRTSNDENAVVASCTAASRAAALEGVATWWRENADAKLLETFDWKAIADAMTKVRAI